MRATHRLRRGDGAFTLDAYDRVGNLSTQAFAFYQDVLSPTVHITVTQATDDFEVSWNISDSGSGLAAYTVQVCPDSPTNCQDLISNPGTSGTYIYAGQLEHTYTFPARKVRHKTAQESRASTAAVSKYRFDGRFVGTILEKRRRVLELWDNLP